MDQALPRGFAWRFISPFEKRKSVEKCEGEWKKNRNEIGRKIVGCSVAADGFDEDEFSDGDSKCSLCQRRFEEQGKDHT